MNEKVNSKIQGESGCIATGLPRRMSRVATENKDLLSHIGSMYYGTGNTNTVDIKDSDGNRLYDSEEIAETKSIGDAIGCFKNSGIDGGTSSEPEANSTYTLKMKIDTNSNIFIYWVKDV